MARRSIEIPGGALVVLIGPAGCGKTTFARRHFSPTEVVSSDHMRGVVSDDPEDDRASADAFELMHRIVDMRLKRGRLTVADATNVRADRRAPLLAIARRRRRPAVAVVFDLPVELCLERNRDRPDRRVPEPGVRHHHRLLRESLDALEEEGFEAVHVLASPKGVEETRVLRRPGP